MPKEKEVRGHRGDGPFLYGVVNGEMVEFVQGTAEANEYLDLYADSQASSQQVRLLLWVGRVGWLIGH